MCVSEEFDKDVKYFVHVARHIGVTIVKAIENYYLRHRRYYKSYSPKTVYKALIRSLSDVQRQFYLYMIFTLCTHFRI